MLEVASAKIDRFGWAQMSAEVKTALRRDWCNTLANFTLDEVSAGIDAVFAEAGGNLRTINEHQVRAQILKARARKVSMLPKTGAPAPEPIDEATRLERCASLTELVQELTAKQGADQWTE